MILKSLRLRNIRSYTDEKVEFPSGSVLLSGDIGSGKTSILLAIEFALFGVRRGELSGESLLRKGKNEGFVEMEFSIEGKEYTIKRALKRAKNEVRQIAGHIISDGVKKEGTALELKSNILELLGYPSDLLTKSKDLIYRYTVYTPQEEMKRILFETKEVRLDTLRKVFGVDKYKRMRENILIYVRELKNKKRVMEARISDLGDKMTQKTAKENEIKELEIKEKDLLLQYRGIKQEVEDAKRKLGDYEKKIGEYQEFKKEMEVSELGLRSLLSQRQNNQKEIEQIASQLGELEKELLGRAIDGEAAKQKINLINEEATDSEKKIGEVGRRISESLTKRNASNEIIVSISKLDICPVCKQEVTESYKKEIDEREKKAMAMLDENIKELQKQEKVLNDKLLGNKKELERLREEEKRMSLVQYKTKIFKEKKQRLALLQKMGEEMKKEIGLINSKKLLLKQRLSGMENLEELHKKFRKDYEYLQQKERGIAINVAEIRKEKETILRNIDGLKREIEEKKNVKKKITEVSLMQTYLEKHFISLVGVIEKHVMLNIHNQFNQFFQNWFNILIESETINSRIDDGFSPLIEQNGYETEIENLSGGEKTSLALAYRLSLNKVINDLVGKIKTKDLLILDEPTDGFSTDQLDKVRDVLEQLDINQVVMVSHESKIESFVDNIVRVVKEEHVSRVV